MKPRGPKRSGSTARGSRAPGRSTARPSRPSRPPPRPARSKASVGAPADAETLERRFDGRAVLEPMLTASGTLADAEDVLEAFKNAVAQEVPAAVVIQALWEDEPRFESAAKAQALFSNLLGLYDLVKAGTPPDLARPAPPPPRERREKASPPPPLEAAGPTDEFVEAAWRYLDDHPKVMERHLHAFDNREDALVSWLDASGLSDPAFGLARSLCFDVFAMLEQGGVKVRSLDETDLEGAAPALPEPFARWVDEGVFEAEHHETQPLPSAEAAQVRALVLRAAAALCRPASRLIP